MTALPESLSCLCLSTFPQEHKESPCSGLGDPESEALEYRSQGRGGVGGWRIRRPSGQVAWKSDQYGDRWNCGSRETSRSNEFISKRQDRIHMWGI